VGTLAAGVVVFAGAAACVGLSGCHPSSSPAAPASKADAPSKVSAPTKEADLATVTLTPEAEKRLGVALAAVERKPVPRTSTYGGEVVVPSGRLIVVASPFNGTLKAPQGGDAVTPGQAVKEGQTVFTLVPILSPESRATMAPLLIEAQGQVKQATEQLKIAKVNLDRTENLVRDRLGGSASLVDAKAQYDLAQTNLRAAEQRREILAKVATDASSGSGDFNSQVIASPASGVLQNLHALPGQMVAVGALLFDVASLDPIWVKVPIYVGDLAKLAIDRDAGVGGLADAPGADARRGKPVVAPAMGNPLTATVDVYYEVENKDGRLRPGERVGVTLPMKGADESLTVPRASLIRDIHGNAWVYEKTGDHAFSRRRVLVDRVVDDLAVLDGGNLKPGVQVVADGAAEIFGAEFGGFK
jgi:RND family efflux transporter MFP subunit